MRALTMRWSWLLVVMTGCASHQAVPPCFDYFPLAPGARWTYDVGLTSGEGSASTTQHVRVVQSVTEAVRDGAEWRFRVDSRPLPADSSVDAMQRYRLGSGGVYDADDTRVEHLLIVAAPEPEGAWGGPSSFFPPGDGIWKVVAFDDAGRFHDCVTVHSQRKYGEITRTYCKGVGPVMTHYNEQTPSSRTEEEPAHHRDEIWKLRDYTRGTCTR